MISEHLKSILHSLPDSPGIYKYFDKDKNLIYIGKAKSLKKRVRSYFNRQEHENRKTAILVSQIVNIEFTLVETEIDALLLENSLIKKYKPKYNINLRDDKTYPFLCIKNERFPRIFVTRNPVKDGSEYFGPYASLNMMYTVFDLIKTLYPLRNCNLNLSEKSINEKKYKTCLEYDIGNCKAPCVGLFSEDDYSQNIKSIKNILKGNLNEVKIHLKNLIQVAAADLKFEEADVFKRKLENLINYQSKSTIVNTVLNDIDVFSIVSDERFAFINYLKLSNGIIIQTQSYEVRKKLEETDTEILSMVIANVRDKYHSTSKEIIVPFELDWSDEKIELTVPKLGDKKKLLDLSLKNALYYKRDKLTQYEAVNPDLKVDRVLTQMKNDLRLKELPHHIECFDNSNLQGTNPVSACVVFKDAKPSKKEYRIFNVKTVEGPNDFATMEEVIFRRYKRQLDENNPLPQLIIIDGGKGQLSSAIESLKKLGLYGKIPVIGIAKRLEELYYPEDEFPLYLDKKSETLKVIQQLRDEAHRYGITNHRNRRSKNTFVTELENIKGIGPETAKMLLKELKSVKKIQEANMDLLINIIGEAKAKLINNYFQNQ